jgi:hypothetical protein
MVVKQGMRWVISNPTKVHNTISEKFFQTQVKAEAQLAEEEPMIPDLVPRDLA